MAALGDGFEDALQNDEMILVGHDHFHARADLHGEGRVGHDEPVAMAEGGQLVKEDVLPGRRGGQALLGRGFLVGGGRLLRFAG